MALVLAGCASGWTLSAGSGGLNFATHEGTAPVATQAQQNEAILNALLSQVLGDAYAYLRGQIPQGSKLAFLGIESSSPVLSEKILDGLMEQVINDPAQPFTVVDRVNLDLIRAEQGIQLSGAVSQDTAQEIGRQLGADTVISGEVTPIGDQWRLTITAFGIGTAKIQGQYVREMIAVAGY
jgi:TolB-like protein